MNKTYLRALLAAATVTAVVTLLGSCGSGNDLANVLTGGTVNGQSARQVALAKQSGQELCCSITIVEYNETQGLVNGCGQQASYSYVGSAWTKTSQIAITGWGSAADRLPNCSQ
jgi:hypothetical protein